MATPIDVRPITDNAKTATKKQDTPAVAAPNLQNQTVQMLDPNTLAQGNGLGAPMLTAAAGSLLGLNDPTGDPFSGPFGINAILSSPFSQNGFNVPDDNPFSGAFGVNAILSGQLPVVNTASPGGALGLTPKDIQALLTLLPDPNAGKDANPPDTAKGTDKAKPATATKPEAKPKG